MVYSKLFIEAVQVIFLFLVKYLIEKGVSSVSWKTKLPLKRNLQKTSNAAFKLTNQVNRLWKHDAEVEKFFKDSNGPGLWRFVPHQKKMFVEIF